MYLGNISGPGHPVDRILEFFEKEGIMTSIQMILTKFSKTVEMI